MNVRHFNFQILEEDSKWEFPRHRLRQSVTRLGEGSFGQVWKFEADNIDGNNGKRDEYL